MESILVCDIEDGARSSEHRAGAMKAFMHEEVVTLKIIIESHTTIGLSISHLIM